MLTLFSIPKPFQGHIDIILLLNDFCQSASRVAAWRDQFLMAGRRWDTDITEKIDFSQPGWREELRGLAFRTNKQRPPCWIDYFVFPRGQYLHKFPPFAVGRPGWDQWMIWYTRSIGTPVVDASRSVMAVHQNHDYAHHPLGFKGVMEGEEAKSNAMLLGDSQRLFTTEHAQYLLEKGSPKWRVGRLVLESKALGWSAWFALLGVTRPVRHALGLRQKRVVETLPTAPRL